ncbi:hypothetical protein [Prosthecobacter sp.]|jgi:hypothetical protein|uniref:hypothetical protein n=1 Tax=Prosthecobacter sp. TaxID=1965333 RepID=UPI0037C9C44E
MKSLLLLGLLLTTLPAMAESQFQVNLVGSTTAAVYVDGAWINDAEAVEAKVSVSPASPAEGVSLKAYFYSADGKLVHTINKPSKLNGGNGGTIPMPGTYEPGKKYAFYFGIPGAIKKGPAKWKRVIVVFGKGEQMSAKIYPKDDLKKFDFPEKSMVR